MLNFGEVVGQPGVSAGAPEQQDRIALEQARFVGLADRVGRAFEHRGPQVITRLQRVAQVARGLQVVDRVEHVQLGWLPCRTGGWGCRSAALRIGRACGLGCGLRCSLGGGLGDFFFDGFQGHVHFLDELAAVTVDQFGLAERALVGQQRVQELLVPFARAHGAARQRHQPAQRCHLGTLQRQFVLDHQVGVLPHARRHLARAVAQQVDRQHRARQHLGHHGAQFGVGSRQFAVGQHPVAELQQLAAQRLAVGAAVVVALGQVDEGLFRVGARSAGGFVAQGFQAVGDFSRQQRNREVELRFVVGAVARVQRHRCVALVLADAPVFAHPGEKGRAPALPEHGVGQAVQCRRRQHHHLEQARLVAG